MAADDIILLTAVGDLGAPGHTLPTAHAGFIARRGAQLRSPGNLAITDVRRVRYLISPTRQGVHDYALFFQVCRELTGWFGHVDSLAQFDVGSQAVLFAKLRNAARPTEVPAGTPRCGTMQVDVRGTAKGVWAEVGVTGPLAGDERRYITLADYPYRPQDRLALSLGPVTLGATVAVVPRQTSGRVNRAFEDVTGDGVIHCYTSTPPATSSWLLALAANGQLTIGRVPHAANASPCVSNPSTWSFGAGALAMVR